MELLLLLSCLAAISVFATSVYIPSIPSMARELQTPIENVQLTLTVFMAAFGISQLVLGPLSDRYGRRPVMIAGMTLCTAGTLICVVAPGIEFLIVGRIVQAIGACSGMVVGRAVLRDSFTREDAARAMSLISLVFALAPALAPVIGGFIQVASGWRANFLLVLMLSAGLLLLVFLRLPETNADRKVEAGIVRGLLRSFSALIVLPGFLAFALPLCSAFFTMYLMIGTGPVVLIDHLGLSPAVFGPTFAVGTLGYVVGTALSGQLTRRKGLEWLMEAGGLVQIAGPALMLALAFAGQVSPWAFMAPYTLWAIGTGMMQPSAFAGAISANPRIIGAASALSGFILNIGTTLGAIAAAAVPHDTLLPIAAIMLVVNIAGYIAWRIFRPPLQAANL